MKLTAIHVYTKELDIVGGAYTMAGSELHSVQTTIVKLQADNGLIGWGEACPLGAAYQPEHPLGVQAALAHLAPHLVGAPVMQPLVLRRHMDHLLNGHNSAKAALDIATLDLLGKSLDCRVCDLLGGTQANTIPSYYALGLGEPNEIARQAQDKIRAGYRRLQIKVGGRELEQDVETIRKVAEKVAEKVTGTSTQLIVDANRGYSTQEAIKLSLQTASIAYVLEQPCNTMDEVAALRGVISHPIALDENIEHIHSLLHAVAHNICDSLSLKVTRLGGLTSFAIARDICEARGLPITCDDTFGGDIIAAACAHGAATVKPQLFEGSWIAAPYIEQSYDPQHSIQIEHGRITIPASAGLGINPHQDRIGECIASYF